MFSVKDGVPCPPKLALTERDCVMVSLQVVPVPLHAPLHPVKVLPGSGVAVSSTWVFQPYAFEHVSGGATPLVMTQLNAPVSP